MNKIDYEKAITEAKDKDELIGVIIAFSQDTSLPWATFRKYYNQAHLRMLINYALQCKNGREIGRFFGVPTGNRTPN